jgi:peptidoglycan/xylan/chitin deacetylase (PgdA/CDA1 family)
MARFLRAWAVVLGCILGRAMPLLASEPSLTAPPASACAFDEHEGVPGLRRSDVFPAGELVLTFDDGPQPLPTKRLLDLLDQHAMPATFFVVGLWVRDDTYRLIQRMVASGHQIGTHTYSHDLYLTRRGWGVDYIEGQYELTHILVELALLSESAEDFRALYRRVVERKPGAILKPSQVRARWRSIQQNHLQLLAERGFDDQHRVYPMLFARPPGGIPYEGHWPSKKMRQEHDAALRHLGLMNVLWHGGSGDTVLGRLDDYQFLVDNVRFHAKKGGVLLIHDRMRRDAMVTALERIAKDPKLRVITLQQAVAAKYGCESEQLYAGRRSSQAVAWRATRRSSPD